MGRLKKKNVSSDPILENVFITNYWLSTEAQKLFGKLEDEKNALDAIQNQIKDLKRATENPKGYKSIVVPSSDVSDLERMLESISEHQIFVVRKKCQTLILALTIATRVKKINLSPIRSEQQSHWNVQIVLSKTSLTLPISDPFKCPIYVTPYN